MTFVLLLSFFHLLWQRMLNKFALLILLTSYGVWCHLQGPDHFEQVVAKLVQDVDQLKAKLDQMEVKEKSLLQKYEDILKRESLRQKVHCIGGYLYVIWLTHRAIR
jgi:hypothetical protein